MSAITSDARPGAIPEARYAYYRRCQAFKRTGEQCKAPAEKGSHICYSHAAEADMRRRREAQRRAVLEEAARRMRAAGARDFPVAQVLGDFRGIQKVLGVMAQAMIEGKLDDKPAARLAAEVQAAAKMMQRSGDLAIGRSGDRKGKKLETRGKAAKSGWISSRVNQKGHEGAQRGRQEDIR